MKIRLLGERILVKQESQEKTTKNGIVLPDNINKEKKAIGIIALLSKEVKVGLKIGDKVLFNKYAGEEVEIEKEEYKILYIGQKKDESDILAVIE